MTVVNHTACSAACNASQICILNCTSALNSTTDFRLVKFMMYVISLTLLVEGNHSLGQGLADGCRHRQREMSYPKLHPLNISTKGSSANKAHAALHQ